MAHSSSFDLMLLDVRMPGIDGKEVLTRIKHDPVTRDLPVVMISAADELETIAGCIEAGADDFLPKPFDPVLLRARVSASVEKKRLRDMEAVLARHGLRRRPSETPVEYLRRVLLGLTARADAVSRLTGLFEQAKFSRHEIDGTMKQDAIGALREIRDDLRGVLA